MTMDGACDISNVPDDSASCECANGGAGGFGGGNEWAGFNQAELDAACLETVASFCGPPPPPKGIPCESAAGQCVIDNEPDSIFCECAGGQGGGGGGGNDWDGLTDDELFDICLEELDLFCGVPPDPEWLCENDLGGCSIDISEDGVFVTCGCSDGGGFYEGDPEWAGLTEDELLEVCFGEIDNTCGAGPGTESTTDPSEGTAGTDTDPTTGATSDTGGTAEGGSSDTSSDSGPIDSTEDSGSSGGSMSGGESNTAGESMSGGESMTASASAGDESSSSDGATAGSGEENPGCSCSTDDAGTDAGLAWGLLGFAGWAVRRRRRPRA